MTHQLKIWPEYYEQVISGLKKFELRENDRDFHVNDILFLSEWDNSPDEECFTSRTCTCIVTSIIHGPIFGLKDGFCIMSINLIGVHDNIF